MTAVAVSVMLIALWQGLCAGLSIPAYIVPTPARVAMTLVTDAGVLLPALGQTLQTALLGIGLALAGGIALAAAFARWRWLDWSFSPLMVMLQVMPLVAVFPLINIYIDNLTVKLALCAWLVAFYPVLSNASFGLNAIDPGLADYFRLMGASRWQTLWYLRLPGAVPHILTGLRIAGGLALVGAVVGEFVTGAAGRNAGLAARIIEAGYRLNAPRLFAALVLIAVSGVTIFLATSWLSQTVMRRWHGGTGAGKT